MECEITDGQARPILDFLARRLGFSHAKINRRDTIVCFYRRRPAYCSWLLTSSSGRWFRFSSRTLSTSQIFLEMFRLKNDLAVFPVDNYAVVKHVFNPWDTLESLLIEADLVGEQM